MDKTPSPKREESKGSPQKQDTQKNSKKRELGEIEKLNTEMEILTENELI